MRPDEDADIRFREYLLGTLPEQRQQYLEERLMTDDNVYEELLIQEGELIDDYLQGNLPEHDSERFSQHFLCTPERHQKVLFARTFRQYVQSSAGEKQGNDLVSFWRRRTADLEWFRPAFRLATAAAFLVLVSSGVLSLLENRRLDQQIAGLLSERTSLHERAQDLQGQLETSNQTNADLAGELRRERDNRVAMEQQLTSLRNLRTASPSPTPMSYVLRPGLLRDVGGESPRVVISGTLKLVELQLDIGVDDYTMYRAVLHEAEGEELWAQNRLEAETRDGKVVVSIELPSSLMSPGDYYIQLSGRAGGGNLELVGRYHFRAVRM